MTGRRHPAGVAGRELSAIRRRAEKGQAIPAADALRLVKALEGVLSQAGAATESTHRLTLPSLGNTGCRCAYGDCRCPGALTVMWTPDPAKVREAIAWELCETAATATEGED